MKSKLFLLRRAGALCVGGLLLLARPALAQTSVTITNATNQVRNPVVKFDSNGSELWVDDVKVTGAAMTNARVPLAHAASHASAGSDPLTLAQAQITGLVDALAGKVPTTRTVNGQPLSSNVLLTTADVADSTNMRYVTDAQRTVIQNTSGTNTGNQVVPANTTSTASQWFNAYDSATGAFTKTQPAFSDLSGSIADGQIPSSITRDTEIDTAPKINALTTDDDFKTLTGSQVLVSPRIGTSLLDSNGNELWKYTATASAVNELTLANAATGGSPTISATGDDANIAIAITPKGTGQILFPDGSNTLPSIAFASDPDNGLYKAATANTIGFVASGAERARLSAVIFTVTSNTFLGWSSTTSSSGSVDTAMSRDSAGVLQINSSVAGTFRDLKLRSTLFAGSTSGTTTLSAPAVAGSAVVTLPGVTSTLASLAGTETFTNKSIDAAQLTGTIDRARLPAAIAARVYNNAVQSISNSTWTILTFNSERWDTDIIHDTSTDTDRLVCKTAGTYLIQGHVSFASNATGMRYVGISLNSAAGLGFISPPEPKAGVSGNETAFTVATTYQLAVNDYVTLQVHQGSGGSLNTVANSSYSPEFMMTRIP